MTREDMYIFYCKHAPSFIPARIRALSRSSRSSSRCVSHPIHPDDRFFNHRQSEKITADVVEKTKARVRQLQKDGASFTQLNSLLHAVELVGECRRVLKWTYVKAYYLASRQRKERGYLWNQDSQKGKELKFFEYQQSELERYTEYLNQLTDEAQKDIDSFFQNRRKVVDWTRALVSGVGREAAFDRILCFPSFSFARRGSTWSTWR